MHEAVSGDVAVAAPVRPGAGSVRRAAGWVGALVMVPIAAYVILVPAYVWGSAVVWGRSGLDGTFSASGAAVALVVAALPSLVAVLTWRATRSHSLRTERLVVALVVGCAVALLTALPFLSMLALPF